MSTPSIPNLLSLRGSRGGGRGRGRSRGGAGSSASSQSHDAIVQGTDTDASVSRLSAVDLGYLQDPFAAYFVQSQMGPPTRRLPIINRGTYARTTALDRLIDAFVFDGSGTQKQIVSLGAGTDTRCLRLFSRPDVPALVYHEVDFPAISARKLQTVQEQPALRAVLGHPQPREDWASWRSAALPNGGEYWCHGLDLRDLAKPDAAALAGLRADVPTLLVSECCLCYLETAAAKAVVGHFTARLPHLAIIVYEPVRPDDPFGRQMVANLAARRIRMPSLEVYKEPADQDARLREAGFEDVRKMTVENIWKTWVPTHEKERVDDLEGLDEVEEWNLLASHYIVAWGWRGGGFDSWAAI